MGWCSATTMVDKYIDLVDKYVPEEERKQKIREVCEFFWNEDWDCESASKYYKKYIEEIYAERQGYSSVKEFRREYGYDDEEDTLDEETVLRNYRREPEPFTDY